ncbi:zinc ribbon domain-containing protein [Nocardia sp. NPDC019395]|uniref:zinc ribbon domain-containing protein n=1 Tax=Nocardia sp. NPDC019395 TaxID=3154686 RepID=UPI00340E9FA9
MTVRCQYCGHAAGPGVGACANCGAPLPDTPAPVSHSGATEPGRQPGGHSGLGAHMAELSGRAGALGALPGTHAQPGHDAPALSSPGGQGAADHHPHHNRTRGLLGFLRSRLVDEAETVVHKHHPKWQWRAAGGLAVAVLLVLAFLMVKSCALTAPQLMGPAGLAGPAGPAAATDAVSALPGPLQAASCRPHAETEGVQSCVLDAASPLLMGEITGGRSLTFQVQTAEPGALAQAVAQWRSAGSNVVADGDVFAAISASSAVRYADTKSGLRIDTGAFSDSAGARTFLMRSGLLQP